MEAQVPESFKKKVLVVGQRIRVIRTRLGISRKSLARMAGVREMALGNWERGFTPIPVAAIWAVADALGVRLIDIIGMRETTYVYLHPTMRQCAEVLTKFAAENPVLEEIPLDLVIALADPKTQERVRDFLKVESEAR